MGNWTGISIEMLWIAMKFQDVTGSAEKIDEMRNKLQR